jgi:hypothetical protein
VVTLARGETGSRDQDLAVRLRDRAVADGRGDVAAALEKLAMHEFGGDDPDQEIHDCVVALRLDHRQRRVDELPPAIERCEAQGHHDEAKRLQAELVGLTKEMSELRHLRGTQLGASRMRG